MGVTELVFQLDYFKRKLSAIWNVIVAISTAVT